MAIRRPFLGEIWKCCHPNCRVQILITNERVRESVQAGGAFYCACGSVMEPDLNPRPGTKK